MKTIYRGVTINPITKKNDLWHWEQGYRHTATVIGHLIEHNTVTFCCKKLSEIKQFINRHIEWIRI